MVDGDQPMDSVSLEDGQEGVLLNLKDKSVLFAQSAYERVYPASITKISARAAALRQAVCFMLFSSVFQEYSQYISNFRVPYPPISVKFISAKNLRSINFSCQRANLALPPGALPPQATETWLSRWERCRRSRLGLGSPSGRAVTAGD